MLVVDAQVHIWGSGPPTNASYRQVNAFSAAELLKGMDEAGIDAAVIHPPGWDPNASEVAIEAAREHPNRLSVLSKFALNDPASPSLIADWKHSLEC